MKKDKALNNVIIVAIVMTIISIVFIVIGGHLNNDFGVHLRNIAIIPIMIGLSATIASGMVISSNKSCN